jgi:hypothetical protein
LEARLGSGATRQVLREAAKQIVGSVGGSPVETDAGSENVNRDVDEALIGAHSERVLAEVAGYGESEISALREAGVIE